MSTLPRSERPPAALGMASLVIGAIGLVFAILPVLGIPVSAIGLLLGLVGLAVNRKAGGVRLRWSLAGAGLCAAALAAGVAMHYAKWGYNQAPQVPAIWQPPPDRPQVSPPE